MVLNLNQVTTLVDFSKYVYFLSFIPSLVSPMNQSQSVQSPIGGTLSNDTTPHSHMTTEQNHSVLSFPEHDISPSQESEKLIHDDSQLKQKAEIIVNDSIQTAREKYQKVQRIPVLLILFLSMV